MRLIIWSFTCVAICGVTQAQSLDLTQKKLVLSCSERFYGSEKGYSVETPHHLEEKKEEKDSLTITVNTIDKTVNIMNHTKNKVLYDLKYMSHAQASNLNDYGQTYTETMFLVRNKEVLMLTHNNKKRVLHLIKNNNELQLFKNLKLISE